MIPLVWQFVLMGLFGGLFGGMLGWAFRGGWDRHKAPKESVLDRLETLKAKQCTREAGHSGACNGWPTETCPASIRAMQSQGAATSGPTDPVADEWESCRAQQLEAYRAGQAERSVFQTQAGQPIDSPRTWDKRLERFGGPKTIPYEELEGMFLDQFLLRYFYSLMPETWNIEMPSGSRVPWDAFTWAYPWAKEMPVLFEQMTGYALNEIQLNNAIAEWARRLEKSAKPTCSLCHGNPIPRPCPECGKTNQRAETPIQRETQATG